MLENTKVCGIRIDSVMRLMLKLDYRQTTKNLDIGTIVQITEEYIDILDGMDLK